MAKDFDPEIGAATRWQKGCCSPNPAGRPKRSLLTDAFRDILAQPFPGDRNGKTFAEVIALRVAKEAAKGNIRAVTELVGCTEGRGRFGQDPLSAERGRVPLVSENEHEQLKELTERLRARIKARQLRISPPSKVP